jgi:hypothetical protein
MPAVRLTAVQWELVSLADGHRSVRDLAYLLGRTLFATTLEVARLRHLRLLDLAPGSTSRTGSPAVARAERRPTEPPESRAP